MLASVGHDTRSARQQVLRPLYTYKHELRLQPAWGPYHLLGHDPTYPKRQTAEHIRSTKDVDRYRPADKSHRCSISSVGYR